MKMIVNFIDLKTGFSAKLLPYQIIQVRGKIVEASPDDETVKVVIPSHLTQKEIVSVPIGFCTRLPEPGQLYFNSLDSSSRVIVIGVANIDDESVFDGIIPVVAFMRNDSLITLELGDFLKTYCVKPIQS